MYNKEELEKNKLEVGKIKKMGRSAIIKLASKIASDNPKSLLNNEDVIVSVWYNDIEVKVMFVDRSPMRYLSYGSRYYYEMEVSVYLDDKRSLTGRIIDNPDKKDNFYHGETYLYRSTEEKKKYIDYVIKLNNSNKNSFPIDESPVVVIREKEKYYDIQIGMNYPITYKIDKESGKIYDFEDLYRDFYPTPIANPVKPIHPGGEWKEMKE